MTVRDCAHYSADPSAISVRLSTMTMSAGVQFDTAVALRSNRKLMTGAVYSISPEILPY